VYVLPIAEERETTANHVPDVPQKVRVRFKPKFPGSGRPPFIPIESEGTSPEYRLSAQNIRVQEGGQPEVVPPGVGNINNRPDDASLQGNHLGSFQETRHRPSDHDNAGAYRPPREAGRRDAEIFRGDRRGDGSGVRHGGRGGGRGRGGSQFERYDSGGRGRGLDRRGSSRGNAQQQGGRYESMQRDERRGGNDRGHGGIFHVDGGGDSRNEPRRPGGYSGGSGSQDSRSEQHRIASERNGSSEQSRGSGGGGDDRYGPSKYNERPSQRENDRNSGGFGDGESHQQSRYNHGSRHRSNDDSASVNRRKDEDGYRERGDNNHQNRPHGRGEGHYEEERIRQMSYSSRSRNDAGFKEHGYSSEGRKRNYDSVKSEQQDQPPMKKVPLPPALGRGYKLEP
jgi:hypothetical protein